MNTYLRSLVLATIAHVLLWACLHYLLLPAEPAPKSPLQVKIITNIPNANNKKPKQNKMLAEKDHRTARQTSPPAGIPAPSMTSSDIQGRQAQMLVDKSLPSTKTLIADPQPSKDMSYADFLQNSAKAMAGITWQEEADDAIDINTSSYRYAGYFTSMRNAISLAWYYPQRAAMEGQQGLVKLNFSVDAQGHASAIRIVKSSGYHLLDEAIVTAIRSASPFQPLPASIGKKKIRIRGSFWYVLND